MGVAAFLPSLHALRVGRPGCKLVATIVVALPQRSMHQERHTQDPRSHQPGKISQSLHEWRKNHPFPAPEKRTSQRGVPSSPQLVNKAWPPTSFHALPRSHSTSSCSLSSRFRNLLLTYLNSGLEQDGKATCFF